MNDSNMNTYKWHELPWQKLEKSVYKLQKRIFQASLSDDVLKVRQLQKLLIKSWGAKCIAVRRISQDNQGKKTAGVDGIKNLSPKQRLALVDKISLSPKASPVRRVWIPKPGKKEKRPLGIPTMYERAVQSLVKMALEPEWEAKFEPNSYGFRPGRSCHDAVEAIFKSIKLVPKYVLDADISQCFDRINHEKLLNKLNTFPTLRRQIRAWLKAGIWDDKTIFQSSEGTPQGGVISPLLANIALHGMEESVKELAEISDIRKPDGQKMRKEDKRASLSLIRYADDFVILHKNYAVVKRCRELISQWLEDMGLELKPSKTRLTHTLHNVGKEKAGFDFLGFNIRQFKAGKYTSGKNTHKELLGFKTLIKPSKKSIQQHYNQIAKIIETSRALKQFELINRLNPIVRGWCNYYAGQVSKKVFKSLDSLIWWKLWKWAKRRHANKDKKWLATKYFQSEQIYDKRNNKYISRNWIFATSFDGKIDLKLLSHADTKVIRHVKVRGNSSPYDGNLIYWSSRMGKHPEMPLRTSTLLKKQKGRCNWCNLTFKDGDLIEQDHIIPTVKGGNDEYKNWQLLHKHCHDSKTRIDGSLDKPFKPVKLPSNWSWQNDMLVTC